MRVDPFAPHGVRWQAVSPRLTTVRLIGAGIPLVLALAGLVLLCFVTESRWSYGVAAAWAVLTFVTLALVPRRVRAWGYAERDDDLLIRRGLMFRSLVVVPYGRMQYVDVKAGPIDRALGLATVQLHTASEASDAYIPGLPEAEAARLRDRLAARGEARLAGL